MNRSEGRKTYDRALDAVFYLTVFAAIACFAMLQAYGDPPDEINRFKVVSFICRHGRLPHGADPEIRLDGFGASYAFQPILTYILQGFLLRFLTRFTTDGYVLLVAARLVNALFGVLMAYFVRQIARLLWESPYLQWTFTLMVVFLPQNIFLHSYINTDSMAMLAVSIIYYALLKGLRTDFSYRDCVLLAVGIILCAMSYYNAYGVIVAAMIVFALHYAHISIPPYNRAAGRKAKDDSVATPRKKRLWVEWNPLLCKGCLISALVLVGIGWWFLRNALLYDGDFIAMNARRECAIQTAIPEYNPLTRFTYKNSGSSLGNMLFWTDYLTLVFNSFVAMFGAMSIPTHGLIYVFYQRIWITACTAALFLPGCLRSGSGNAPWSWDSGFCGHLKERRLFCGSMLLFCLITIALSIFYSYTWDFQPQGRYILPVLIPFMHLVTSGIGKAAGLFQWGIDRLGKHFPAKKADGFPNNVGMALGKLLCLFVMSYVLLAFAYSLFLRFLPYYSQHENLFSLYGQTL